MSRLEEIKINAVFLTDNDGDFVDIIQLSVDDYAYLYERVEELEEEIYQDTRQAVIESLYADNQRYKQALEEIRREAGSYMSNSAAQRLYDIANKALEESE